PLERRKRTMTTTTTTMAPAPAHLVSVSDAGTGYRAECSCGWASDPLDSLDLAELAGFGHPAEAVGPSDWMDRLMSGLLDLQDDVAAVVIWLAENWSAHLPELGWHSNGNDRTTSRPAVSVIGYCTPAELVEAAAVLGVAPV